MAKYQKHWVHTQRESDLIEAQIVESEQLEEQATNFEQKKDADVGMTVDYILLLELLR